MSMTYRKIPMSTQLRLVGMGALHASSSQNQFDRLVQRTASDVGYYMF